MRFKQTKNAGIELSEMAVGTWAIGGAGWGDVNEEDSIKSIRAMIDHGVTVVDTAPIYGNGHSEEVVGKALLDGYREKVILATKCGLVINKKDANGGVPRDASYASIMQECEDSLKRLQTDHIDIYIVHWPDVNTPIEETMKALNELKAAGKIRFIGFSNHYKKALEEAMKYGTVDFVQQPYSMVKEDEKAFLTWCESQGIAIMSYASLGSGILTGTIREIPNWDPSDTRFTFYDYYKEPKFSKIQELLKEMDKLSEKYGKPIPQIAINWSSSKHFVHTCIVGVRNEEEAAQNAETFTWQLDQADIDLLDRRIVELGISDGSTFVNTKKEDLEV